MAEKVEGSFVFTVLDKDNSIWFVVGDNPLCVMFYDGFLIYASTQEILCKTIKKLRLKAPTDILEPKEGEILKIDRNRPYHHRHLHTAHSISNTGGDKYSVSTAAITRTRPQTTTTYSVWRRHSALPRMRCRPFWTMAALRRKSRKCCTTRNSVPRDDRRIVIRVLIEGRRCA